MFIDGAMGTMIQRLRLTEEDFRGKTPSGASDPPLSLQSISHFLSWGEKRKTRDGKMQKCTHML